MGLIEPYLEAIRATKRPILRQHTLQKASNALPPGALTALYLELDSIGGRALCKLAPCYRYMTGKARRRAAKQPQLVPQDIGNDNWFYHMPAVKRAEKTIYILFAGAGGQFFLPLAVILQLLPSGPKDVLVLRGGAMQHYRAGLAGFGLHPSEVSTNISGKFRTAAYKRRVVIGMSIGGFYALGIGGLLQAEVGISVSGVYGNGGYFLKVAMAEGGSAFDPICACRPVGNMRMINVLASKNEFDFRNAQRFKKLRPGLRQFHLVNGVGHNVLAQMLRFRTAGWFFRLALMQRGWPFWLLARLTYGYGSFVRAIRLLFGVQRLQRIYRPPPL